MDGSESRVSRLRAYIHWSCFIPFIVHCSLFTVHRSWSMLAACIVHRLSIVLPRPSHSLLYYSHTVRVVRVSWSYSVCSAMQCYRFLCVLFWVGGL